MTISLYIEGGGASREEHIRCREGFRKLLEHAGLGGTMPRIIAGGGRHDTFRQFQTATRTPNKVAFLLVDSEEPVHDPPWTHVQRYDGWHQPPHTTDAHLHFMATCMETWIVADRVTLRSLFGAALNDHALPPLRDLEQRSRQQIQTALADATRPCGRDRQYQKGVRSFAILAHLDSSVLQQHLPHFRRLIETLSAQGRDS